MKADISADFHVPAKRYVGVRGQQGRILSDADFNAAFDAVDQSLEGLVRGLLCEAGSPDDGFLITGANQPLPPGSPPGAMNFNIAKGSFVLGGRMLHLAEDQIYLQQSDWLSREITRDPPARLPASPAKPALNDLAAGPRHDLVFLEMTDQPVRAVEDREIQDRALGGADTATRVRPQARVRVLTDTKGKCSDAANDLRGELAGDGGTFGDGVNELSSKARLAIGFTDDQPPDDPCAPRETAGYQGSENQMLKVMLTAPDKFVWAYDNGEPLYRVVVHEATTAIEFLSEPRDPVLYPRTNQVIEILPWDVLLPNHEKAAAPLGVRLRLTSEYNPATSQITYSGTFPTDWNPWLNGQTGGTPGIDEEDRHFFYARIWQEPPSGGVDHATGPEVVLPGTGVKLMFFGKGLPGDYWSAALRTDTPQTIVPWSLMDPGGAPPSGPRRFYAPLALITWQDENGAVTPTEHDCRVRIRRLCRVGGCCTYQVGDGLTSFGDFNDVQKAVDALPAEGGELCLLPGRHEGLVTLEGLDGVRLQGCGRRTVLAPPPGKSGPVITIIGGKNIELEGFDLENHADLAVLGQGDPGGVILRGLGMRVTGSAVRFTSSHGLTIERCLIHADPYDTVPDQDEMLKQSPLLYLSGQEVRVLDNLIEADADTKQTARSALGGMQIAGGSEGVRIEGNRISGGNGNGIALGSVKPEPAGGAAPPAGGTGLKEESIGHKFQPRVSSGSDGCGNIDPDRTRTEIPLEPGEVLVSEGPVTDLGITENEITGMGMSGISVAFWFVPDPADSNQGDDDIEIEDAVIARNAIVKCMRLGLAGSQPLDLAFASALGGIVLSAAVNLRIDDNDIRDCGGGNRTPICGIYLRSAEILHITGNRIHDNGSAAQLGDPLLIGSIGGIVISMVESGLCSLGALLAAPEAQPRAPALFVKDNVVVSPEGRALEVTGTGPMLIEGNSLTCYGNNGLMVMAVLDFLNSSGSTSTAQQQAIMAQLGGSAVMVINLGMAENAVHWGWAAFGNPGWDTALGNAAVAGFFSKAVVGGEVQFNDNIVTYDALSSAWSVSFCSVFLASLDDAAMHDNQSTVDSRGDFIFSNTIAFGLMSLRVQGNRFRETRKAGGSNGDWPASTYLSALTMGYLNATENNQGTHCFVVEGQKKPRVILKGSQGGLTATLDTNRYMIDENDCETWKKFSLFVSSPRR